LESQEAEALGDVLVAIATAVRRYKSEHNLPLGMEIKRLQLAAADPTLAQRLKEAAADLNSVTRARIVEVKPALEQGLEILITDGLVQIALDPGQATGDPRD
jgi:hypothetical protein